jgi:hypothetical protein
MSTKEDDLIARAEMLQQASDYDGATDDSKS